MERDIEHPTWWDASAIDSNYGDVQKYPIDLDTIPGKEIVALFKKTLPNIHIFNIESVQNQMLYDSYWN